MPVTQRKRSEEKVIQSEIDGHPYLYTCNVPDCGYHVACDSIESGIRQEQSHICPRQTKLKEGTMTSNIDFLNKRSTVPRMWEAFDKDYREFNTSKEKHKKDYLGIKMRGMAEMLYLVMIPYYDSPDDIVHEVIARAADSKRDTPGIGWIAVSPEDGGSPTCPALGSGYTNQPATMATPPEHYPIERIQVAREQEEARSKTSKVSNRTAPAKRPPPKPVEPNVTEEEVALFGAGHAGGFTVEMLASAYGKTKTEVEWALKRYAETN